ncbi:response regulator transcription factor [Streptomyces sp. NPDC006516]|uniref:response regulator transcription factor n=1 Tax=Streptomyces sp. NPDC006516 TaxID=3154309 RepID=UPI00339EB5E3
MCTSTAGALVIRVLLAEDLNMVRGALVALLNLEEGISVVADVERGDQIVQAAREHRPDVAILDIDLPGLDGLTAGALLHEQVPECRVLILTSLSAPGTLRRAMSGHVYGFLAKDAPPDQLAEAVRRVASGSRVVDPQLAMAAWGVGESPLTARESEVLQLAAEGSEASEIATRLYLSKGTVRNYLTTIVSKLNARNRVDAVRIARESGWLV